MSDLRELQLEFINRRYGTFIHFNSATLQFNKGDLTDWEYGVENFGETRMHPFTESDWAPSKLDCSQWADIAAKAGCRFSALTSQHHEGFALWPTKATEHCIRNAAVTTDVVGEYLAAFRAKGISAGLYYSVLDLTAKIGRNKGFDADKKKKVFTQIEELLTGYGEIPFLIIDGWDAPWGGPTYDELPFTEVDAFVKSLQPNCLLMNIGKTKNIGDTDILFFENGAGQALDRSAGGPGVLCNKLTDTWFWRASDSVTPPHPAESLVPTVEDCFDADAAFICNLSPNTDGLVDENLAEEFIRLGKSVSIPEPLTVVPDEWQRRK